MVYVMSDIHGLYDRYEKMLEKINLTPEDTLYVLGDVIDRGEGGIRILLDIMSKSNIKFLRGNHEQMMYHYYTETGEKWEEHKRRWERNVCQPTQRGFESLPKEQQIRVLEFIQNAPYYAEVEAGNRKYYLTHGAPLKWGEEDHAVRYPEAHPDSKFRPDYWEAVLWERIEADRVPFTDKTLVFGHSCTERYQDKLPYQIWFGENKIDIDCGCGDNNEYTQLGCLCLDNLKEYYV